MHVRGDVKLVVQMDSGSVVLACVSAAAASSTCRSYRKVADVGVSWLGLVWLMNLYNSIDGIDGMAAIGRGPDRRDRDRLAWASGLTGA